MEEKKKNNWFSPYESPEEAYIVWYLDELAGAGIIEDYTYQPKALSLSPAFHYFWEKKLKTKTKPMKSTLLQEHVYTPDFLVQWSIPYKGVYYKDIEDVGEDKSCYFFAERNLFDGSMESYWEVKPAFDRNNMIRLFYINQKWIYEKYMRYVQKIIPRHVFENTFTPQRYLLTDTGRQKRKINFAVRSLEKFYNDKQ